MLQDAAVVGRVFWVGALVELTERPIAEVRDALGRLRVKELVVPHEPSSFRDEQEFAFRHGLIRDGAYDSLPKSLRADKHLGTAKWAADRAGDRAEEIAELIATHEIEAVRYLDELGERRPQIERAAFDHAWAAARRTSALGLGAESTRWYREAERLAGRVEIPLEEQSKLFRGHAANRGGRAQRRAGSRPRLPMPSERLALLFERDLDSVCQPLGLPVPAGALRAQAQGRVRRAAAHARSNALAVHLRSSLAELVEVAEAPRSRGSRSAPRSPRRGRRRDPPPTSRRRGACRPAATSAGSRTLRRGSARGGRRTRARP